MKKTLSLILSAFALTTFAQGTATVPNQAAAQTPAAQISATTATATVQPATTASAAPAATSTANVQPSAVSTTPATNAQAPAANAPTATPAATIVQPTLADAQKAYVNGKWKDAAVAYETACPQQPAANQTECYLWNVLALSQTGVTADFVKAGKRLDSLIQKTDSQNQLYADLVMTRAQFMLYLGKNSRAAESLILAIDNAQPRHKVVLQKVCTAVQAKVKNDTLNQRCTQLNEPAATVTPATVQTTAATQPTSAVPAQQPATAQTSPTSATPAMPATVQPATQPAAAVQPTAPAQAATPQPTATPATPAAQPITTPVPQPTTTVVAAQPAATTAPTATASPAQPTAPAAAPITKEAWVLQLGAFGVKSNADLLVSNLKKRGITCKIEERVGETKTLYIVQTTAFETKEKAIDFGATKLAPLNVEFRAILKK